jgi:membrane protease YdiL (CAAX protease family)
LDSQPTAFPDLGVPLEATDGTTTEGPIENAILPLQEITPPPPPEPQGPWLESLPWSGLDLLFLALVLFFGIVLFTAVSMGVIHATQARPITEIAGNPSVWIVVPAEGAAYLVMFAVLYALANGRSLRFWPALSWQWPSGFLWIGFLFAGFVLAIVVAMLQKILPMPKSLPIEQMFLQPGAPQLLAFFGVAIAPFAEETLFRGLLYPVSNRWLRHVLNSRQRIRRGRLIFLLLVPLGFFAHRLSIGGDVLLACAALVFTGTAFAMRAAKTSPADAARVLLPGLTFLAWGLAAHRLSFAALERTSLALMFLVFLMTILGLKLQPGATATRIGISLSFALTAISFTLLHSEQLAGSWAPLLVLLLVSSVLTFTRAQTKSLASSVLIHVGYNATLFGGAYFATDHFRHLEHIAH